MTAGAFMKKMLLMLRESWVLAKKHRMYFLLPFLILTAILSLLAFKVGPGVIVSFVYAGL